MIAHAKALSAKSQDFSLRSATEHDLPAIFQFLRSHGKSRQFFPAYSENDISSKDGLLRGMAAEDIFLAVSGREILGTSAIWNQTFFRQWIVKSYATPLHLLRPLYNSISQLMSRPLLPKPGSIFPYRMLSLPCVVEDRAEIFAALLNAVIIKLYDSGQTLLLAGFHEHDPLKKVIDRLPNMQFRSRLYLVYWPDGEAEVCSLNNMVPYVEVGGL